MDIRNSSADLDITLTQLQSTSAFLIFLTLVCVYQLFSTESVKMKAVIILCTLLGVTLGAPSGKSAYSAYTAPAHVSFAPAVYHTAPAYVPARAYYTGPVVTGTLHHAQDTYGQYKFGYSSSDGQDKTESRGSDGSVAGGFSYTSPEGKHIKLSYTADKDGGFRAYGDHLPEAPEPLDVPDYLADAYREAHGRLAQAYDEARYRGAAAVKHAAISYGTGGYARYGGDDGSYLKYAAAYDDGSYRPDDEGSYERYAALYDDGSYKPGLRRYQSVAVTSPLTYHRTITTSAAYPGKIVYGGAGAAAAYAAAPAHTGVSYSANIGGTAVKVPAAAVVAAPAGHAKSAYAYHG